MLNPGSLRVPQEVDRTRNVCLAMAEYKPSRAFQDKSKPTQVRLSNIIAAKCIIQGLVSVSLLQLLRTASAQVLALREWTKWSHWLCHQAHCAQIQSGDGDVTITNDGATILSLINVVHPAAKMVVALWACL